MLSSLWYKYGDVDERKENDDNGSDDTNVEWILIDAIGGSHGGECWDWYSDN
jgi:hypothetical protein